MEKIYVRFLRSSGDDGGYQLLMSRSLPTSILPRVGDLISIYDTALQGVVVQKILWIHKDSWATLEVWV